MADLLVIDVKAPALTIGSDEPLAKVYRFKVADDVDVPQQGQLFVVRNDNGEMNLMQRLSLQVPDPVLSCVKPDLTNIRAALEWLDG